MHYLREDRVGSGADILCAGPYRHAPICVKFDDRGARQAAVQPSLHRPAPNPESFRRFASTRYPECDVPTRISLRRPRSTRENDAKKTASSCLHLFVASFSIRSLSGSIFNSSASSFIAASSAYRSRNSARSTHVHRRAQITLHQPARHFKIRNAVEIRRRFATALVVVIE